MSMTGEPPKHHSEVRGDLEPHVRAIGRLVVNFNALEHTVHRLAWTLLNAQDDRPGQIVTDRLEASKLEEMVKALIHHSIKDQSLGDRVDALLARMPAARSRRNEFVHSFVRIPNDSVDLSQARTTRRPTRSRQDYVQGPGVTEPTPIEQAAKEAFDLGVAFEELYADVRRLQGAV